MLSAYADGRFIWTSYPFTVPLAVFAIQETKNAWVLNSAKLESKMRPSHNRALAQLACHPDYRGAPSALSSANMVGEIYFEDLKRAEGSDSCPATPQELTTVYGIRVE